MSVQPPSADWAWTLISHPLDPLPGPLQSLPMTVNYPFIFNPLSCLTPTAQAPEVPKAQIM
jgi:hypothetical protein